MGRTRFLALATFLGHERLLRLDRLVRTNRVAGALLGPILRWFSRGSVRVTSGLGFGLRVSTAELDLSHAHAGLLVRGDLEPPVQEAFRRLLGPGSAILDVGANIGFFSLLAARLVGPHGRVVALEPVARNATAIRRNAELNGLGSISVIEKAAAASAGRGELLVVEDASWSKLADTGWHDRTSSVEPVELVAIDDLVESGEVPPPDVVKIDTEGSEVEILRGMARTLERHRPALVIELHGTHREVAELLRSVGYELENLTRPVPLEDDPDAEHALARPAPQASAAWTAERSSSAERS